MTQPTFKYPSHRITGKVLGNDLPSRAKCSNELDHIECVWSDCPRHSPGTYAAYLAKHRKSQR